MVATNDTLIKWCEVSTRKYEESRFQHEELWEIFFDDFSEAIAMGVVDIETLKPTSTYKCALMNLLGVL